VVVYGGRQEEVRRRQRRQNLLRLWCGHRTTLNHGLGRRWRTMSANAQGLCEFIDVSPSPLHVCVRVAERLRPAGFRELAEGDAWPATGDFFVVRAGSLVAWRGAADAGLR